MIFVFFPFAQHLLAWKCKGCKLRREHTSEFNVVGPACAVTSPKVRKTRDLKATEGKTTCRESVKTVKVASPLCMEQEKHDIKVCSNQNEMHRNADTSSSWQRAMRMSCKACFLLQFCIHHRYTCPWALHKGRFFPWSRKKWNIIKSLYVLYVYGMKPGKKRWPWGRRSSLTMEWTIQGFHSSFPPSLKWHEFQSHLQDHLAKKTWEVTKSIANKEDEDYSLLACEVDSGQLRWPQLFKVI